MIIEQVLLRIVHNSNFVPVIFNYENKVYYYAFSRGLNAFTKKESEALRTNINIPIKTEYIPSLIYKKLYGIPNYANNPN